MILRLQLSEKGAINFQIYHPPIDWPRDDSVHDLYSFKANFTHYFKHPTTSSNETPFDDETYHQEKDTYHQHHLFQDIAQPQTRLRKNEEAERGGISGESESWQMPMLRIWRDQLHDNEPHIKNNSQKIRINGKN